MKLSEIKVGLVERFFANRSAGVTQDQLGSIFEQISKSTNVGLGVEFLSQLIQEANQSSDPSKAFKRFTDGRVAFLSVFEEEAGQNTAIFAAVRVGTIVKLSDLTLTPLTEKIADLGAVKSALRQAKNLNDEIFYHITVLD